MTTILTEIRISGLAFCGLAVVLLSGCGSAKAVVADPNELPFVQCRVELGGDEIPGAIVAFHSEANPSQQTVSVYDSDIETYRFITTIDGKPRGGVPAGDYVVTVKSAPKSKIRIPDKYANAKTSGLTVKIEPGKNFLKPIAMDK